MRPLDYYRLYQQENSTERDVVKERFNDQENQKKKQQKKSFPWVIRGIGRCTLIGAIFLFAKRGNADSGGTPSHCSRGTKHGHGLYQIG